MSQSTAELAGELTNARGRKPLVISSIEFPAPSPEDGESTLNRGLAVAREVEGAVQNIAAQQFECAKLLGQMQAFDTLNKYTGVGLTVLLRQMQESRAYKGLKIPQPDGTFLSINTFEDFCKLMGTSHSKVKEDIQNLNAFGEAFMESAQKMGIGYRDLRKLRTLPEGERLALAGGDAASSDPEILKDLLEEIAAKRAEDRKALEETRKDYDAQGEVLAKKDKALNEAKKELIKFKHIPPSEQVIVQGEREQNSLKELHAVGLELLGVFTKFSAKAQGILDDGELSLAARETVLSLASGLCRQMADTLLDGGIDIDFRVLAYPLELGNVALRGEAAQEDSQAGQNDAEV